MPKPKPLAARVALVTGAGSGIGKAIAHRLAAEGACVVVADIDATAAEAVAGELGGTDTAISVVADVTDEAQVADAFRRAVLAFGGVDLVVNNAGLSISKPLLETTAARLGPPARRHGPRLVPRLARGGAHPHRPGDGRRPRLHRQQERASSPGPNNVAYGASKADQAHQVRLLAAELGQYGIRVNGVNPDGVVRGSGIFAKGWGADRARTYGIPEDKLGEFYAQRTLLKHEVLPEHVAAAVFALTAAISARRPGSTSPSTRVSRRPSSGDRQARRGRRPRRVERAGDGRAGRPRGASCGRGVEGGRACRAAAS